LAEDGGKEKSLKRRARPDSLYSAEEGAEIQGWGGNISGCHGLEEGVCLIRGAKEQKRKKKKEKKRSEKTVPTSSWPTGSNSVKKGGGKSGLGGHAPINSTT